MAKPLLSDDRLTVACVLKWTKGCPYTPEYVRALRDGVERNLSMPYRFVCLSNIDTPCWRFGLNHDWPRWWSKMELFRPGLFQGDVLFFDLDTIIVDDLTDIASVGKFTVIANWDHEPGRGNGSGMMFLTPECRERIWAKWIADPEEVMRKSGGGGDGKFVVPFAKHTWGRELPGQVASYKKNILPSDEYIPGTRVICFHGTPRPHEMPKNHWTMKFWL